MTELQLGLLGIGIVVVAAVFAYNKFQEARLKRQSEEAFGSRHDDVLLEGQEAAPRALRRDERIEPTLSALPQEPAAGGGNLDAGIDAIANMEMPEAVSGEAISSAIVDSHARPARIVTWEGYNAQSASWEPLAAAGAYRRVRAGLQLADRNGAASAQDLQAFDALVESVALATSATRTQMDAQTALQRAQQLDGLCADVDVQIVLNLLARGGLASGTRIRAFVEAQGLVLERDGRFCRRDDAGLELYSLSNMEAPVFSPEAMKTLATKGLTLQFDVARVPGGIKTFDRYVEFARALAESLSAEIVDDNRRALDANALAKIRTQLQALYASMDQQGIPAGGPLAMRLFA